MGLVAPCEGMALNAARKSSPSGFLRGAMCDRRYVIDTTSMAGRTL